MAWTIEISNEAEKNLRQLAPADAKRITDYLYGRVVALEQPRRLGKPLQGTRLGELWRYRVGDSRVLCRLQDQHMVVLVIKIGHRRDIYR